MESKLQQRTYFVEIFMGSGVHVYPSPWYRNVEKGSYTQVIKNELKNLLRLLKFTKMRIPLIVMAKQHQPPGL